MKYTILAVLFLAVMAFGQVVKPVVPPILKAYTGDTVDTKVLVPAVPAMMVPRVQPARINKKIGRNDWIGFIVYHKPAGQPIAVVDSARYKLINADSAKILVKMPIDFIRPDIDTLP